MRQRPPPLPSPACGPIEMALDTTRCLYVSNDLYRDEGNTDGTELLRQGRGHRRGASGIGCSTAELLVDQGARAMIGGRDSELLVDCEKTGQCTARPSQLVIAASGNPKSTGTDPVTRGRRPRSTRHR